MTADYEQVKNEFLSGKIENCETFFEKNKYFVEAGYCNIISDNLARAKYLFEQTAESDTRAKWGLFLISLLTDKINIFPTYFEIRNFLEIDLNILIQYYKADYVEKIIKYSDFMAYYNPECYKFIGRTFWANNLMPAAMFFLRKAKDKLYNDPELHYLLGYIYYYNENNIEKTQKALNACLNILPDYYPAKNLLQIIENNKRL